ncbi:hypothetical protein [Corynebacterium falsenii]
MAHAVGVPLVRRKTTAADTVAEIQRCWRAQMKPMDIARRCRVDHGVVYRIGMQLGVWVCPPLPLRQMATRRRREYLMLRLRQDSIGAHV